MSQVIRPEASSTQTRTLRGSAQLSHPATAGTSITFPSPTARAQFASAGSRPNAIRVGDRTRLLALVVAGGADTDDHLLTVVGWVPVGDMLVPTALGRFTCNVQTAIAVGASLETALGGQNLAAMNFCDTYTPTVGADYPFLEGAGSNDDDAPSGPVFDISAFEWVETLVAAAGGELSAACIATLY